MKKFFKILGIVFVVVILLLILASVLLVIYINPNKIKPKISQQVYKITGQAMHIAGDIHWSFYPSLALKFKQAELSNLPEFGEQPFVKVDEVRVSVKLLPLLARKIELDHLYIDGLTINLIKNRQGIGNWQLPGAKSVVKTQAKDAEIVQQKTDRDVSVQSSGKNKFLFHLKQIDCKNVNINWSDMQSGQQASLQNITFQARNIQSAKFFPIKLSLEIKSNKPDVNGNVVVISEVKADINKVIYNFKNFNLNSKLQGKDVLQEKLSLQLKSNLLITKNDLRMQQLNFLMNDNKIAGELCVSKLQNITAFDFINILRQIDLQGELKSDRLQFEKLVVNNLNMKLQGQNGIIKVIPLIAQFYSGKLQANAQLDMRQTTPVISAKYTLNDFNLYSFVYDLYGVKNFTGVANTWGSVTAKSFVGNKILQTLNGVINFRIKNGVIKGIDIPYLLYSGRSFINTFIAQLGQREKVESQSQSPRKKTDLTKFDSITALVNIKNGVASNNDLLITAPDLQGNGRGIANLVTQQLDYKAVLSLKDDLSHWAVPIIIKGHFKHAKVELDRAQLVNIAKKMLQEGVQKQLQKQIQKQLKDLPIKIPKFFR